MIKDVLPPPGTKKRPRHAGFPLRGLLRETLVLIGLSGVFRLISTGLIVSDPFGDQYYYAGHYTYLDKYRNKSGYVVQSFKTVDSNECGDNVRYGSRQNAPDDFLVVRGGGRIVKSYILGRKTRHYRYVGVGRRYERYEYYYNKS